MHIVGGTYRETCKSPQWDELYGSGLRAASAIAQLDSELKFSTYANESDDLFLLTCKSKAFGFKIEKINPRPNQIVFSYFHPLSTPTIYSGEQQDLSDLVINDANILRFGMLEKDAIVNGNRVVYDPQSPICPVHFHENGSTAEFLALVLNLREAKLLSRETELHLITDNLFSKTNAKIIIIKKGSYGCDVFTGQCEPMHLPAFETINVWPIGTGDIFSATFAHYWAEKNEAPFYAAEMAMKATALYSQTASAKLPIFQKDIDSLEFPSINPNGKKTTKKIYLASPFFTLSERWFIEEARSCLSSSNINVFSPFHDVGRGKAEEIYVPDIKGIIECDTVFANLCGLDSGTIYEIGYAVSLNKPVVVFSQNNREDDLKMITGGGCKVFDDFSTAIYHAIWEAIRS